MMPPLFLTRNKRSRVGGSSLTKHFGSAHEYSVNDKRQIDEHINNGQQTTAIVDCSASSGFDLHKGV